MPKFPEGKELFLMNMADTREIEYILVQNTKWKSDLWKNVNLRQQKRDGQIDADVAVCKQCDSVVKLAGGISNMSKHLERHHTLSSPWSPLHVVGMLWFMPLT